LLTGIENLSIRRSGIETAVGILLDSTAVAAAERAGQNPRQLVEGLIARLGDAETTLSVITVTELAHGIERADNAERRSNRERFLTELEQISVEPVTVPIAIRAGRMDGALQANGVRVALGDLLIGATALELGYSVATHNVRHFESIPGLEVLPL
jgi:predicted nucleic acid-binding protein